MSQKKPYKVNLALGYKLYDPVNDGEFYFYPNISNTDVYDKPFTVNSSSDARKVISDIRMKELADTLNYPKSSDKLKEITAFKIFIDYRDHALGDSNALVPEFIKKNRYLINFPTTNNNLYKSFKPIDILEFDQLEECFELNINVYGLDVDTNAVECIPPTDEVDQDIIAPSVRCIFLSRDAKPPSAFCSIEIGVGVMVKRAVGDRVQGKTKATANKRGVVISVDYSTRQPWYNVRWESGLVARVTGRSLGPIVDNNIEPSATTHAPLTAESLTALLRNTGATYDDSSASENSDAEDGDEEDNTAREVPYSGISDEGKIISRGRNTIQPTNAQLVARRLRNPLKPIRPVARGLKPADVVSPGEIFCVDECMSSWQGNEGKYCHDGMPHKTKFPRKPEGAGAELKSVADGDSGVLLGVDLVEGVERQNQKAYHALFGEGTAVILRLTEVYKGTGRTVVADSVFASVKTLVQLE
ncbi:hypothetical protein ON010_g6869 [Phytophthora cinnamomi]|nr:hypothetical protein ON010_g6869 [Phytophthora cinnamomi]